MKSRDHSRCWKQDPKERPTFEEIVHMLNTENPKITLKEPEKAPTPVTASNESGDGEYEKPPVSSTDLKFSNEELKEILLDSPQEKQVEIKKEKEEKSSDSDSSDSSDSDSDSSNDHKKKKNYI